MMTKLERAQDMLRKMDAMADAKGALRCGLIWDVTVSLKTLIDELTQEGLENDKNHDQRG